MTVSCEKVGLEFFETAPARHHASVEVEATPEEVFEVLLDAESWTKWAFPQAFRFNEVSKGGVQAFAEDYRVTDLGGGRSRGEWTMAMDTGDEGPGFRARLMGPIMSFMVRRMLKKFGRLVESNRSSAAAN